ncbi:MAG: M48 family metalloprotease [Candidatus Omnitrophica bacterium]|nr:M48 family metalloprotease [Candidatus Omnitrophota bacterium]MDD5352258.1 M48 family metalloprotease [Candidatus Omnitrophota bacterium]MDD5549856.1 M48 family metalloprotease [Candidatus Omnitrophota bacterium]
MRKVLLLLFMVWFISGCATAPISQSDFGEKTKLLNEKDEIQFGNYVDAYILGEQTLLENEQITKAVSDIGNKIVAVSYRPNLKFTFRVLNEHQVNAFAGPGGYVYVTRGLLDHLKSKDELAAVLAHEVSHVCARHQVKALYNAQTAQTFMALGQILAIAAGTYTGSSTVADLGNTVAQMATIMVYQGYSRSFEAEADKLGDFYMYESGYNPEAMADVFDMMLALAKEKGEKKDLGIFATHPSLEWRAKRIREIAPQIKKGVKYEEIE